MAETKKKKVFCIGENKTGTTSLFHTFTHLKYKIGQQRPAELLLDDYLNGNHEPIINYCNSAEFFQDIPFSKPKTYEFWKKHFLMPNLY